MIFDELVLHNFGVYQGEHKVALAPLPGRPIVLFGALNGSGKTTFLEAMQLALYGKGAKPTGRGRLAYHDYLARAINRYVEPSTGAGLQFTFRHRADGKDEAIRLVRTWNSTSKGVRENFEVWRDETLDAVATDRWTEFVEDVMPMQISDLFFFDGEKIESLADPQQSAALLRVGLHSLLGLDLVDQLVRSLGIIERRRKTAQLAAPDKALVDQLEDDIRHLESKKADAAQRAAQLLNELELCEKAVSNLEKQLETSGGRLFLQRRDLEEKYRQLARDQATLAGHLSELAAGDAPLLLVEGLLAELRSSSQAEPALSDPLLTSFVRKRDERLLRRIKRLGLRPKQIEAIKDFLKGSRPTVERADVGQLIYVPRTKIISVSESGELRQTLVEKLNEFEAIARAVDRVERNLAAIPQEESVKDLLLALEQARLERERTLIKRDLANEEYRRVCADIEKKDAARRVRLEEFAEHSLLAATTQRVLRHSVRARETLAAYREEIARGHMERLEQLITVSFGQLHRKRRPKYHVAIDRETYELRLHEDDGKRVTANELSAGERQLLAVSVLWALAQASGRKLPTVIDTPLGRLDSKHRHFLIQNYFPQASHQVILFSTDEEVSPAYYDQLKPSIGREYCIEFDEERRSSVVTQGYFSRDGVR